MARTRIAMILSGCGQQDGTEVTEAVLSHLALARAGCEVLFFAPSRPQARVVDHTTGHAAAETRDALVEAARIARGRIRPLSELDPSHVDGAWLPGGSGALQTLAPTPPRGDHPVALPELAQVLRALHAAGKPIGAVCIAPLTVLAALGAGEVTLGPDAAQGPRAAALGGVAHPTHADQPWIDTARRLVSVPAFMDHGASIEKVAAGIDRAAEAFVAWATHRARVTAS
ncbi:MAG: isoprenoid biosynthesis protein with amidotransferase-like domain [Pseudomonadota bacterium]|jgi:enhancing lycopene biosynthesis protein 2